MNLLNQSSFLSAIEGQGCVCVRTMVILFTVQLSKCDVSSFSYPDHGAMLIWTFGVCTFGWLLQIQISSTLPGSLCCWLLRNVIGAAVLYYILAMHDLHTCLYTTLIKSITHALARLVQHHMTLRSCMWRSRGTLVSQVIVFSAWCLNSCCPTY